MLSINDEEEKALRDDNISAIRNQTQSGLSQMIDPASGYTRDDNVTQLMREEPTPIQQTDSQNKLPSQQTSTIIAKLTSLDHQSIDAGTTNRTVNESAGLLPDINLGKRSFHGDMPDMNL